MVDNGNSYQKKYDGASGTYQQIDIDISNGDARPHNRNIRRVLLVGAAVAIAVGVYYGVTMPRTNPQAVVNKAISSSGTVQVKSDGKLKLFDNLSKSQESFRYLAVAIANTYKFVVLLGRPLCAGRLRCAVYFLVLSAGSCGLLWKAGVGVLRQSRSSDGDIRHGIKGLSHSRVQSGEQGVPTDALFGFSNLCARYSFWDIFPDRTLCASSHSQS